MTEDQRQKLGSLLDDLSVSIDVIESFGWSLEGKDFLTYDPIKKHGEFTGKSK